MEGEGLCLCFQRLPVSVLHFLSVRLTVSLKIKVKLFYFYFFQFPPGGSIVSLIKCWCMFVWKPLTSTFSPHHAA